MSLTERIESFMRRFLTLTNPVQVTSEEMGAILRDLRHLKNRPNTSLGAEAARVGLVLTWRLGPQRAREAVRGAYRADSINAEEEERLLLGIAAASIFPPPPERIIPTGEEVRRVAERVAGLARPRIG